MFNEDIATIITPLIKPASIVELRQAPTPEQLSTLSSHFGGKPYAEVDESWPVCPQCKRPLSFICQINMSDCKHETIPWIGLFTFFYCWECYPLEDNRDLPGQWLVRLYPSPQAEKAVSIEPQQVGEIAQTIPCSVVMKATKSLPDWDGIVVWCSEAEKLSVKADLDEPWKPYLSTVEQLIGEAGYVTMVGGYPYWVQYDATPKCSQCGERMELLAQIDSENVAGIMWGDAGLVYLFVCPRHPFEIRFETQCF